MAKNNNKINEKLLIDDVEFDEIKLKKSNFSEPEGKTYFKISPKQQVFCQKPKTQMNIEANPPPESSLTVHHALCSKKTKVLKEMIDANHFLIYEVFDTIIDILRQNQESKGVIVYCFFVLEELINDYGIPVILLLNNPDITESLYAVSQHDFQQEVLRILDKCLSIFSFDKERSMIGQLAELWFKVNSPETPFPDKQLEQTRFNMLFAKVHKVSLAYEESGGLLSSIKKRELLQEMKEILEKEDFSSKGFNPMEKELALYYRNELQFKVSALDESPLGKGPEKPHVQRISRVIKIDESDEDEGDLHILNPKEESKIKEEELGKVKTEDSMNIENEAEEKTNKNPVKKGLVIIRGEDNKKPLHIVKASESPKAVAIHLRKSFILNERVNEDENNAIEYKDFGYPFDKDRGFILQKTICSFLNRRGGRIYIGINDNKYVKGVYLTSKERDELKLEIFELTRHFEPSISNEELLQVVFLPIQDKYKKEMVPGLFMVKIIVKQGDPSELYSISKLHFQSYLRNDGQSVQLSTREITEAIKRRDRVPEHKVPSQEWDDPSPENLVDVEHRRSNYNYDVRNRFDQALKYSKPRKHLYIHKENHNNGYGYHKEKTNYHHNNHHYHNNQKSLERQKEKSPNNSRKTSDDWAEKKKVRTGTDQEVFEVVVSNLPTGYSQEQWEALLKQGKYKSIVKHKRLKGLHGKSEGKVFVGFSDIQEASKFIDQMNQKQIGKSTLHADFSLA